MTLEQKLQAELKILLITVPMRQREVLELWGKFIASQNPDDLGRYVKAMNTLTAKQGLMEFLTDVLEPDDGL